MLQDHNFQQTGPPNQKQKMAGPDPNHFDPSYFQGHDWHTADLKSNEKYYKIARQNYERAGVPLFSHFASCGIRSLAGKGGGALKPAVAGRKIIDVTVGGKCQVFEKVRSVNKFPGGRLGNLLNMGTRLAGELRRAVIPEISIR